MAASPGEKIINVRCTRKKLRVDLYDGRSLTVPLAWFPKLSHATPKQRCNWKIAGAGFGIHWADLDEDLSIRYLLQGIPALGVELKNKSEVALSKLAETWEVDEQFDSAIKAFEQVDEAMWK